MSLIVQKFGGTSVGSLERIQSVAERVIKNKQNGHDIIVVASAMSGETDRLVELSRAIQAIPDPREYSSLVSTGEQVSVALIAMALMNRGFKARSYTGNQARILTDDVFDRARIAEIDISVLQKDLADGIIPVVAGFQGVDSNGNITTLGRGGSDTTAVALAAVLKADECQIYTDVDGIYTTDPRVVSQARRLNQITFEEMLELASLGAKVLQIRSVEFAGRYNVPLRVLSSFVEGPGTLITYEDNEMLEQVLVSGIAFNRSEAKISVIGVPDKTGLASKIIGAISRENIDIDMIIQNIGVDNFTDFTFTIHRDNYIKTMHILKDLQTEIGARTITGDNRIAKISLIGVAMRSHPGVASKMFDVLAEEGINIQAITTSEIKISVLVDEKYLELGVRALHDAFELERTAQEEFDPIAK